MSFDDYTDEYQYSSYERSENCNECAYAVLKDIGYSNWTVEGTNLICTLAKRKRTSYERYEDIPAPHDCDAYKPGIPIKSDVEDPAFRNSY